MCKIAKMRHRFSPRKAALAAAVNCFSVLALCLVTSPTVTERPGRPARHSRLSGENNNVGDLSQLGQQNITEGDAASPLMTLGHYGHQGKVEREWRSRSFRRQRRNSSSTSMSPDHGRLPGRSPANKSTRRPSKTLVIPALIGVALLVLWQVGNVFVKCLERAGTVKQGPAYGSSPRALSDTHKTPDNVQTLCRDFGLDILVDDGESIPLLGSGEADSGADGRLLPQDGYQPRDRNSGQGSSINPDIESGVDGARVQTRLLDRSVRLILPVFIVLVIMVIVLVLPLKQRAANTGSTTVSPTVSSHTLSTTTPGEVASSSPGSSTAAPSSNPTSSSAVTVTTSPGGSAATSSSSSSQPSTMFSSTAGSPESLPPSNETSSPLPTTGLLSPSSSSTGGATSTGASSPPPSLPGPPSSTTPGASSSPPAVERSSPVLAEAPPGSSETTLFSSGDSPSVKSTTSLPAETPTVSRRPPQDGV